MPDVFAIAKQESKVKYHSPVSKADTQLERITEILGRLETKDEEDRALIDRIYRAIFNVPEPPSGPNES